MKKVALLLALIVGGFSIPTMADTSDDGMKGHPGYFLTRTSPDQEVKYH